MELRWILLGLSIVIIAFIAWHTRRESVKQIFKFIKDKLTRKNGFDDDLYGAESLEGTEEDVPLPSLLSLRVKATPNETFGGQQLLIQLNSLGLRFGDMDIFHYQSDEDSTPLFSLASAYEPGTFDIDRIDHLETDNLLMFMQPDQHDTPAEVFDLMLETAENLAERLNADLLDHRGRLLTDKQIDSYFRCLS